jgi:hypothetical protein
LRGLGALQEKVKMVVHPTVVQEPDREGLAIPVQPLEEVSVVAIGLEHDLAVMASIHHMNNRPTSRGAVGGVYEAWLPSAGPITERLIIASMDQVYPESRSRQGVP